MLSLGTQSLVKIVAILLLFLIFNVNADNVTGNQTANEASNANSDDDSPIETQSAQCTITAGDIQASAQASTSKKLEGICGTKQMAKSFEILEGRLLYEIYQIRLMLASLYPGLFDKNKFNLNPNIYANYVPAQQYQNNGFPAQEYKNNQYYSYTETFYSTEKPSPKQTTPTKSTSPIDSTSPTNPTTPTTKEHLSNNPTLPPTTIIPSKITDSPIDVTSTTEKILEFRPVQTKSLKRILRPKITGPRDFEVHKFNNTILAGDEIRIFTYYWKMENFTAKLMSNVSHVLSPIFSISGLHLRVKATLNHLNRDYLYLQLESVPSEQIEDDNIVLETGEMFKEIETKTLFKHKIVILDQGTPNSDLISQEFFNTNAGFMVPNSAISSEPFCRNDSILIKVVIIL